MDLRKKSRDFAATENIGSEVLSTNLISGDVLNSRPPLGIEQCLTGHPVRNGLLADGRSVEEIGDTFGQGNLAASDVDSPFKGGNVRFFHGRHSTRILVDVNKDSGFTYNKKTCTLYDMQQARNRKETAAVKPVRKRKGRAKPAEVGPDGRTMPQRLRMLMLEHDPPFIPEDGGQTALAKACQVLYANGRTHAPSAIKQQNVEQMLAGQDTSRYLPVVAKVFGVNCLWLQFGIGEKYEKH